MARLLSRLADPKQREWIRPAIKGEAHWDGIVITSVGCDEAALVGRSVQEIAAERRVDPQTAVMDILLEQQGNANIVEHCQSPDNLHALLTHPLGVVITDGVYTVGRSHPRLYGTFPLLLGHYVRERRWLSLEAAVHKVTGKPAAAFHLHDRGVIAKGRVADITVFDPEAIHTDATYEKPDVAPAGIRSVWRKGQMAVNQGAVV
jgi:N-acyl-D-amino-acid deacylase